MRNNGGREMDWHELWNGRGQAIMEEYDLASLIAIDGFDCGAGRLTPQQFQEVADLVADEVGLLRGVRLLEVGCGAGALLWCLRDSGAQLYGVDYSANMIEHVKRAIPEGEFAVAEASSLPFRVDVIVCHSVFQYFPNLAYARSVLEEFSRCASVALILDIPDAATRQACETARASAGSKPGGHLYYPRSFFSGKTWTNPLSGYGNAPYRFHALVSSRKD